MIPWGLDNKGLKNLFEPLLVPGSLNGIPPMVITVSHTLTCYRLVFCCARFLLAINHRVRLWILLSENRKAGHTDSLDGRRAPRWGRASPKGGVWGEPCLHVFRMSCMTWGIWDSKFQNWQNWAWRWSWPPSSRLLQDPDPSQHWDPQLAF